MHILKPHAQADTECRSFPEILAVGLAPALGAFYHALP
jgi:hypothetical protein